MSSASDSAGDSRLARRLGLRDATAIGLGSMVGAGIFSAFGPAAGAAGPLLLVGLLIAGAVAFCNATSSAQLAAQYPASGGTYIYGRERLNHWWGFLAGWAFVVGKIASCAAMALTCAAYVWPGSGSRIVAVVVVVVVVAVVAVNYLGITRTASVSRVIATVVIVGLLVIVAAAWLTGMPTVDVTVPEPAAGSWYGVLQASGFLFFAFAGYARIATLGEEVRRPERTIPRAIVGALGVALVVYVVVGVTLVAFLPSAKIAASGNPLFVLTEQLGLSSLGVLVVVLAAIASGGALLALVAGVGRTTFAMAREGDLPKPLAAVHPRFRVPHRAELLVGAVVVVLVVATDLRSVIAFSSLGVLVYYAIANAAALTQTGAYRRYPRALQWLGFAGCAMLVATLPVPALLTGLAVLAVGLGGRWILVHSQRLRRR